VYSQQLLNVGSGSSHANIEILDILRARFSGIEILNAPARQGDIRDTLADVSLAKEVLGWSPEVQFEEGLGMTLAWWGL